MRLLLCTAEDHPTFRADVAVLFGKYLPRLGISSDLLARIRDARAAIDNPWPGGHVHGCAAPRSRLGRQLARICSDLQLLWRPRNGYDALVVRDKPLSGVLGLIGARIAGIPYFYWMSFPMPEAWLHLAKTKRGERHPLYLLLAWLRGSVGYWLLYRVTLRFADHVFVQSNVMRDQVAAQGIPRVKMTPVPMGVDIESATDVLADAPPIDDARLNGRRVIVYLGALDRIRQPGIMVRAMLDVRVQHPDALLCLIGGANDPKELRELEVLVESLDLSSHIYFTGMMPMRDAWRYARRAEVGLSPYPRSELLESGSPTKVVEYLALSVPVVANEHPDQALVLRASGGGIVAELSSSAFASAICSILDRDEDAQRMGAAGREYVASNRSYEVLGQEVAKVLRDVTAKRSSTRPGSSR